MSFCRSSLAKLDILKLVLQVRPDAIWGLDISLFYAMFKIGLYKREKEHVSKAHSFYPPAKFL